MTYDSNLRCFSAARGHVNQDSQPWITSRTNSGVDSLTHVLRHLLRLSISPLCPQFIQSSRNMQHHHSHQMHSVGLKVVYICFAALVYAECGTLSCHRGTCNSILRTDYMDNSVFDTFPCCTFIVALLGEGEGVNWNP